MESLLADIRFSGVGRVHVDLFARLGMRFMEAKVKRLC